MYALFYESDLDLRMERSKNMKKIIIVLCIGIINLITISAQNILPIVPYPETVNMGTGKEYLSGQIKISYSDVALKELADVLANDLYVLNGLKSQIVNQDGKIQLSYDSQLAEEEYKLNIGNGKIEISGGGYNAVCMGVTSFLQLTHKNKDKVEVPRCNIHDKPAVGYRTLMLDVAREWNNPETIKQAVELCRWYKMRYLQLHLTDDQSFTFPSKAYPKLATKDRHYTLDELKEIVEFARKRGIVIIPELDLPGHSTPMRKAMPELFGAPELSMIDIANEEVYTAVETIIKEMMEVFYTSPYFHIGADEVYLGEFQKQERTKEFVKKMNFDNAHDIYLYFIAEMHKMVKRQGKQSIVWESFAGTGSRKVQIPTDIYLIAWETLYQRPESLLANGYKIITSSWKPAYVCPGLRWGVEYIYNWNIRRWENHWNVAPSYHNPIQLNSMDNILGGQMSAWEMNEEQQIASLHQRIPAMSEVTWNNERQRSYGDFRKRYLQTDKQYSKITFPVEIIKKDFREPDYEGNYYNRENRFGDRASVTIKPLLPNTTVTYTTDGSMPKWDSPKCPSKIDLDNSVHVKMAVFDSDKNIIGFKPIFFELDPIKSSIKGKTYALRDTIVDREKEVFSGELELSFQALKKGGAIKFTRDGSNPSADSETYTKPIVINSSQRIKALFFMDAKPCGRLYNVEFVRRDIENNITTNKKVEATSLEEGGINTPEKAVDGIVEKDYFWDSGAGPASLTVDLEKPQKIQEIRLFTYWDNSRYYQYTVEVSADGKKWQQSIDRSANTEAATENGYTDKFNPTDTRYIKVNMLKNSANPSMHIVEVRAY